MNKDYKTMSTGALENIKQKLEKNWMRAAENGHIALANHWQSLISEVDAELITREEG